MLQKKKRKKLTDQAFDVVDGPLRVGRRLVLRRVADQPFAAVLRECDVRGRDAVALVVGDDLDAATLVDADARVSGPEVDADDGAEGLLLGLRVGVGLLGVGLLGAGGEAEGRGGERCVFFWLRVMEREKKEKGSGSRKKKK